MEDQESLLGIRGTHDDWVNEPLDIDDIGTGTANAYAYKYQPRKSPLRLLIIPFLFLVIFGIVSAPLYTKIMSEPPKSSYMEYRTVVGYFQQDDQNTKSDTFDFAKENFGLIEGEYDTDKHFDPERKLTQWQRFEHHVHKLNTQTPRNIEYKVLYLARHGEAWHNIAESYYGSKAWDCYWSFKEGNGEIKWADSHLAPSGIAQAIKARDFWETLMSTQHASAPQTHYVSPMTRCLETASHTFNNLTLPSHSPFNPTIKELLREEISAHTCDRRSTKTQIHALAPTFNFEPGFPEHDPYWRELLSETHASEDRRFKTLLDDIFSTDNSTFIAFSTHSGAINTLLRVLSHRTFILPTGAIIPVLVKAEKITGDDPNPPYTGPEYVAPAEIWSVPPPLPTLNAAKAPIEIPRASAPAALEAGEKIVSAETIGTSIEASPPSEVAHPAGNIPPPPTVEEVSNEA